MIERDTVETVRVTVYLPIELAEDAKHSAGARGQSLSEWFRRAAVGACAKRDASYSKAKRQSVGRDGPLPQVGPLRVPLSRKGAKA